MTTTHEAPATQRPRHIGFIADGHRRWARAHGLTLAAGFRHGTAVMHQVLAHCRTLDLETASIFLMSVRNFQRPDDQVVALVDVMVDLLDTEARESTGPIRVLSTFGGTQVIPGRLGAAIRRAEAATADRPGMTVCFGIGYDGRADIHQAVARALLAPEFDDREVLPVDRYLTTAGLPNPDLIVRTSGERRLSGFLLHQAADATLHFDDRYWPDYDAQALDEALAVHAAQHLTFGR
ncbi:polyprenyl diphosphate synthase [Streptomyces sp. NPDC088732]|uniref:polyprenyl diphosphate synthase n=1 Tax=Streptomyces sp. NPDC088732 TaxID=3365879 RepID=UPI0037FDE9F8